MKLDQESLIQKLAQAKKRYFGARMRQRTQAGGQPYGMGGGMSAVEGYEGAGSYDLSDFTAAPGTADFGDFGGDPQTSGGMSGFDGGGGGFDPGFDPNGPPGGFDGGGEPPVPPSA